MPKNSKLLELEQASISKLLLKYSLPAVISMAAMSIYNLIDAYYIGYWCGSYAIAALALIFPIMNITFAFSILIGLGSAANVSICLGRGEKERAFHFLGNAVILSIIIGFAVGGSIYFFLPEILAIFGAEGETYDFAYDFMKVCALGYPITSLFITLNQNMRSSGYPYKSMQNMLITVVANVILCPIFIYYLGWGIMGAAIATSLAQALGLLNALRHFFDKSNVTHFRAGIFRLDFSLMRHIFLIGLPPFLLNLCGCVVVLIFNRLILSYDGPIGVAAFGIVNRITFLFAMIALGIAQGMQPILGYNYGMGNMKRVYATLLRGIIIGSSITGFGWALVMLFPTELISIFVKASDPNALRMIELGSEGITIIMAAFFLVGSQIVISNFFLAIGKPFMSIILTLSRQVLILIPLLHILPNIYGAKGIWLSGSVSDFLAFIACLCLLIYFLSNQKKRDKITSSLPTS